MKPLWAVGDQPPQMREIVGVVGNAKHLSLQEDFAPEMYLPVAQIPHPTGTILLRTETSNPATMANTLRAELAHVDPNLPLTAVRVFDEYRAGSLAGPRFNALLLSIFAAVALLLTAVGIYGVIAYSVSQRTGEIGIRMALGALPSSIFRLVVGQAMTLVAISIGIGFLGALACTRLMRSLLYAVGAWDPATFILIAALIAAVAFFACWMPARRAARSRTRSKLSAPNERLSFLSSNRQLISNHLYERPSLRSSPAPQIARLHHHRRAHPRARHRREQRHLQRGQPRSSPAAALSAPGAARLPERSHQRNRHCDRAAGLRRLAKGQQIVRAPRPEPAGIAQPERHSRPRTGTHLGRVRDREFLQRDRSAAADRPDLYRRRRQAGRAVAGRHQRPALGPRFSSRPASGRASDAISRHTDHRHRGDAAGDGFTARGRCLVRCHAPGKPPRMAESRESPDVLRLGPAEGGRHG